MGWRWLRWLCLASWLAVCCAFSPRGPLISRGAALRAALTSTGCDASSVPSPLLIRALRGEPVERTPIWLMRQAGRYMSAFRNYSDRIPFRTRSEDAEIAVELSLQPYRRFGVDGVIFFSDILTPLPALGVDFHIKEGKGPVIAKPVRTLEDIDNIKSFVDVDTQVPFVRPILQTLRAQVSPQTAVIGFVGAPWTLGAYSVEGGHSKLCRHMKSMCYDAPVMAHQLLSKFTAALCEYADHQICSGAQTLQIFESWAHHLSEDLFLEFAKPYVDQLTVYLKERHPHVPIVYYANGGSPFLSRQLDMAVDALSLDWHVSMKSARDAAGPHRVLCGNLDPLVLYSSAECIRKKAAQIIADANGKFVFNLGHGVEKDMSEESVETLVDAVHSIKSLNH